MEEKIKLLASQLGDSRITQSVYIATTTRELIRAVELCRELEVAFKVVGSKIINEFPGLVIRNRSDNIRIFGIKGKVSRAGLGVEEALLEVDSGVSVNRLAEYAARQKLSGLEGLQGLEGTVGGSFFVNPNIFLNCQEAKVLNGGGEVTSKIGTKVEKEEIILSVIFKLKAVSV
jgi:UDP-N-acetylenolpyruvoylglucosamine reductase